MLFATAFSLISAPLLGIIGDLIPSKVLIPLAFALRGASGYLFLLVKDPESYFVTTLIALECIATGLELVSINILFYRGLPGQIRGTMMGFYQFFGHLGMLTYTLLGG